jgi:molybdate transport system regulatory protein
MAKTIVKSLRFRLWIDIDGERFFGPGRADLLQHIHETGSISKAAKAMGMSYKKAWAMVDEMNSKAHTPYVIAQKGGQKGGGTELTKAGAEIVKAYQKIIGKISVTIEKEKALLDLV